MREKGTTSHNHCSRIAASKFPFRPGSAAGIIAIYLRAAEHVRFTRMPAKIGQIAAGLGKQRIVDRLVSRSPHLQKLLVPRDVRLYIVDGNRGRRVADLLRDQTSRHPSTLVEQPNCKRLAQRV